MKSQRLTFSEREALAAERLEQAGLMISRPGEGHPQSDVFDCWGVCTGSHGGYAKTLRAAMRRCLGCCGIGEFWRTDFGNGEMLRDLFGRVTKDVLG